MKFTITRVVTRNIVMDSFQSIRNIFGLRLRGYEKMIDNSLKEMLAEMELKYNPKWFKVIVNPLTNGSAMIIIYGEENEW